MKLTVHNVVVNLGDQKNTKPSKQVWDWELPILNEKYPGGMVVVTGTTTVERDELPDAEDEFGRLVAMYGVEEGTNQSFVHLAYDRGDKGVKALDKALKGAVYTGKKAAPVAAKPKSDKDSGDDEKPKSDKGPTDPLD